MRTTQALRYCLSAVLLLGCGQSAVSAPKPAPQADVETSVGPSKQRELPRLIAPPPKYGNKIVMAQAGATAYRF